MLRHLGSTAALALGILAIVGGLASVWRGRGSGAGDLIISGPVIILGALAYRSAKKRWLGQVASTKTRRFGEGIAILLIFALLLPLENLKTLVATQPVHYVIIPVYAIVAYMIIGFRAPKHDQSMITATGKPSANTQT